MTVDLAPATRRMADLITGVPDDALDRPTPCPAYSMTQAGGVNLPGEVAGLVALDELVIHGVDVARASGQAYDPGEAELQAVHGFVGQFSGSGQEDARAGLFGPEVEVADDAPLLERVIGLTGRDPAWSPA